MKLCRLPLLHLDDHVAFTAERRARSALDIDRGEGSQPIEIGLRLEQSIGADEVARPQSHRVPNRAGAGALIATHHHSVDNAPRSFEDLDPQIGQHLGAVPVGGGDHLNRFESTLSIEDPDRSEGLFHQRRVIGTAGLNRQLAPELQLVDRLDTDQVQIDQPSLATLVDRNSYRDLSLCLLDLGRADLGIPISVDPVVGDDVLQILLESGIGEPSTRRGEEPLGLGRDEAEQLEGRDGAVAVEGELDQFVDRTGLDTDHQMYEFFGP